ncbi:hypothetical protein FO519_002575 [Halicephalobus sp. NKZ332]|nr:hypothetical protein FO519_002575 [Halicephalobus sp. NKZ332]
MKDTLADSAMTRMLSKFRNWIVVEEDTSKKIKKFGPFLVLIGFVAYLLFGATSFWFFERGQAARAYRQHFLHLAVNRRQFARDVSQRIFNDTKNLFVVMDLEQSNRVQTHLINSLREYEKDLKVPRPPKDEWDFGSSLGFAWGLLTTLGHSTRSPRTLAGQLFTIIYAIVGVPFFIITILLVAHKFFTSVKRTTTLRKRHLYYFGASAAAYFIFLLGFAYFLYYAEILESFWRSIYVTILSAFSIHSFDYAEFSEADKLLTIFATTVSLLLGTITLIFAAFVYETRESSTAKVVAADSAPGDVPRFQVIVNESGDTKIQPAP